MRYKIGKVVAVFDEVEQCRKTRLEENRLRFFWKIVIWIRSPLDGSQNKTGRKQIAIDACSKFLESTRINNVSSQNKTGRKQIAIRSSGLKCPKPKTSVYGRKTRLRENRLRQKKG